MDSEPKVRITIESSTLEKTYLLLFLLVCLLSCERLLTIPTENSILSCEYVLLVVRTAIVLNDKGSLVSAARFYAD